MSAAVSYLFSTKEISGARYHLEATWLDIDLFLFVDRSFSDLSFLEIKSLILSSSSWYLWREFLTLVVLPDPLPRQLSGRVRDRPKSQILIWQSLLIKILPGLRSRWIIFPRWSDFKAHNKLYNISLTWLSVKLDFEPILITFLRSDSSCSITRKTCLRVVVSSARPSGTITSRSCGMNIDTPLEPISWAPLISWISLITLTQSYSNLSKFDINLMATCLLVCLQKPW